MSCLISNLGERLTALWADAVPLILILVMSMFSAVCSNDAHAGFFELSGSFSFSHSGYADQGYSWSRRWNVTFGYYFFTSSEIELSVQDAFYRTKLTDVEDTTFHDKIYSIDWVQSILPRHYIVQPYFKLGLGELNRNAGGSDMGLVPTSYNQFTTIVGAGTRISIIRELSLKFEGITYLTNGDLSTWQQNFALQSGIAIFF